MAELRVEVIKIARDNVELRKWAVETAIGSGALGTQVAPRAKDFLDFVLDVKKEEAK